MKKKRILTYKEYYRKHFGKVTAADILFGWFDYCEEHGIKDPRSADEQIKRMNQDL